jgi:hypothetical protein
MQRVRVLPYRQGSKSAKNLAVTIGAKVLKLEGSKFFGKYGDLIINWGRSRHHREGTFYPSLLLNEPACVAHASNKLKFFQEIAIKGLTKYIPKYYTDVRNIQDEDFPIVCRTILTGNSGIGIVISAGRDTLVNAPLYVKYEKKRDEYRIHLGRLPNGEGTSIIAAQRKARRMDHENPNWQVRNHNNGFVFARNDVDTPQPCLDAARLCFEATELDFGAVDVIYNAKENRAYVLEINTAPGLEGQTVLDYANFFKSYIDKE